MKTLLAIDHPLAQELDNWLDDNNVMVIGQGWEVLEDKLAELVERIQELEQELEQSGNSGELPQTRYDWSKAPEWAQWAATDKDGVEIYFEFEPKQNEFISGWLSQSGKIELRDYRDNGEWQECLDWQDSLEQRPKGV